MRQSFLLSVFFGSILFLLTACGGGGSSNKGGDASNGNSSSSVAPRLNQTITFPAPELEVIAGDTQGNIASKQSSGATTYSSGDNTIATVDNNGLVTAKAAGTVTITATVAADQQYAAATGSYVLHVRELLSQAITFSQPGPFNLAAGNSLINEATGAGSAEVTYTSSNPAIAIVDDSGYVSVLAAGTAVITASKARDDQYYAATSSFTVTVTDDSLPKAPISAWIGESDTLAYLPESTNGYGLYRSGSANCDLSNYQSCVDGQYNILNNTTVIDTAATLNKTGYYVLKNGAAKAALTVGPTHVPMREGNLVVSFKNKFFSFGETAWTSPDGQSWEQLPPSALSVTYGPYSRYKFIEFKDKLWAISDTAEHCTIWSSVDGINWELEITKAAFFNRANYNLYVHNNQLFLLGGNRKYNVERDIWSTDDGANWVLRDGKALFISRNSTIPRDYFSYDTIVKYNDQFIMFRPAIYSIPAEVWTSTDGLSWEEQTLNTNENELKGLQGQFAVFKNKIWYTVANTNAPSKQIWSSKDGLTWKQELSNASIDFSQTYKMLTHNNQLFISGEQGVWSSINGVDWVDQTTDALFLPTASHQVVTLNNQLWLLDARFTAEKRNQGMHVYTSADGINWHKKTLPQTIEMRINSSEQKTISFNNKLWVIGGYNGENRNEVWSSSDGTNWTQEIEHAAFYARSGHDAIEFNNKLWLVGGFGPASNMNDVWSSADGVTWAKQTDNAAFSARISHKLVSFDNRLWLIGGQAGNTLKNDVWSSTDGINWELKTVNAPFAARAQHQAIAFNGRLWVIGGRTKNSAFNNDVWSSVDGITWQQQTANADFLPRNKHQVVVFQNQMLLTGGATSNGATRDTWISVDGVHWRRGYRGTFDFKNN